VRWLHAVGHALAISGSMTWEILWALILGFALSAVVQAAVRRSTIIRRLGDDRPKTLAIATGFGAASSSCSYAAVALARSLFRQGASFTAAIAGCDGDRLAHNPEVAGSNPAPATSFRRSRPFLSGRGPFA
jgi:uncharacterized membrane protein YraQ (UPF0718 family)